MIDLTRAELMDMLRRADREENNTLWNAAVECLSARYWVRTDEYVLRGPGGPLDPEVSASILRRHRRRHPLGEAT